MQLSWASQSEQILPAVVGNTFQTSYLSQQGGTWEEAEFSRMSAEAPPKGSAAIASVLTCGSCAGHVLIFS